MRHEYNVTLALVNILPLTETIQIARRHKMVVHV